MVNSRFSQIKNTQMYYENKEELEANIIENNLNIIHKSPELLEEIYKYIENFLLSDKGSLNNINSILENIKNFKGIDVDKNISITEMLFNLIINTILLPDYIKELGTQESYDQIKEIIENSIKMFEKKVELILNSGYKLTLGNSHEILVEIKENQENGKLELDPRIYKISEIGLLFNIFNFNNESGEYEFSVLIDGKEKINKFKRPITKKILENIINKLDIDISDVNINIDNLNESDLINNNNFNSKNILKIGITYNHSKDITSARDIIILMIKLIEINNEIINKLSIELGYPMNGGINVFATGDAIPLKITYHNFEENKDNYEKKDEEEDEEVNEGTETTTYTKNTKFDKMELDVSKYNYKLNDIGGLKKEKQEISRIISAIKNEKIMKSWGTETVKGIIFEGPAGTGKTLFAKVIASELDTKIYNIKLTDIMSSAYINTGSNNIRGLFDYLREEAKKIGKKIIVILDELDALCGERTGPGKSEEDTKVVNTFLSELGGIEEDNDIMFIGTTNLIEKIDPTVIRSGRLSDVIKIGLPDKEGLKEIYKIYISKASKKSSKAKEALKGLNHTKLSELSEGLTGADVEEIIRNILEKKAYEEIRKLNPGKITLSDIKEAIDVLKSRKNKTSKKREIGFHTNI